MRADLPVVLLSFLTAALATPLARRIAHATGYLDRPSERKAHREPVPLLGGAAVVAGIAVGLVVSLLVAPPAVRSAVAHALPALAFGLALATATGLVDDRRGMQPLVKLSLQLACGVPLVAAGGGFSVPGAPLAGALVSLLWIATVMNAANFLDNMDGVLASVALVTGLGLAFLGGETGDLDARALALALAGGAGGFLLFNFPPARIFLGDTGSLPVGFALGAASLLCSHVATPSAVRQWAPPVLVLGYLLFDITLVTVVRLAERRPVYLGGTDHSSHRLRRVLGSPRRALGAVCVLAASSAGAGLVAARLSNAQALFVLALMAVLLAALGVTLVRTTSSVAARAGRS